MNLYILDFAFAFFATAAFAVIFYTPKKDVWLCGLVGGIAWWVYKCIVGAGFQSFAANFTASFVLALVSGFFAYKGRKPLVMFLSSGAITLVPGLGLYDGLCAIALKNYDAGGKIFLNAGIDAISIAVGLMLGTSIYNIAAEWQRRELISKKQGNR